MAMTYNTLVASKETPGSIKYWVRHGEIDADGILADAQALVYATLRVQGMKTRVRGSILTGASTLTLPTGFLEAVSFYRGGDDFGKIAILDEQHFESRVGVDDADDPIDGCPSICTMDGTTAYFNTTADKDYLYRMWYMGTPAALALANQSNFLCTRYPTILGAACRHYAYSHRENDEQSTKWFGIMSAAIEIANGEYDLYKQSVQHEMYWDQDTA